MAKQENTVLRGQIGGIDFFIKNGKGFGKQAAKGCRQTVATKQQAGVFGQASRVASLLWRHLKPWSAGYTNNNAWNRLNRAIANWVRMGGLAASTPQNKLPYICGFQFNTETVVNERLRFAMQVSRAGNGTLELNIPSINPVSATAAPARTRMVCLNILALTCTTNNTTLTEQFITEVQIPYTNTILPGAATGAARYAVPAAITVVAIAVAYYTDDNMQQQVSNPVWMPAGIVAALFN